MPTAASNTAFLGPPMASVRSRQPTPDPTGVPRSRQPTPDPTSVPRSRQPTPDPTGSRAGQSAAGIARTEPSVWLTSVQSRQPPTQQTARGVAPDRRGYCTHRASRVADLCSVPAAADPANRARNRAGPPRYCTHRASRVADFRPVRVQTWWLDFTAAARYVTE